MHVQQTGHLSTAAVAYTFFAVTSVFAQPDMICPGCLSTRVTVGAGFELSSLCCTATPPFASEPDALIT